MIFYVLIIMYSHNKTRFSEKFLIALIKSKDIFNSVISIGYIYI